MSWVAPWGGYPPPASGGGSAATGQAITVASAAAAIADYPAAALGTLFTKTGFAALWVATGTVPTNLQRLQTAAIGYDPADVPQAAAGETFTSQCVLPMGIGTAIGDDGTGWLMVSVNASAPFAEGPWYDAGIAFPDGLEMWDGAMTRWVWSNANQLWNRVTTISVATLAELATLVPGTNEAFADDGDVGPALTVWCAETEITYTWSGAAWYLR